MPENSQLNCVHWEKKTSDLKTKGTFKKDRARIILFGQEGEHLQKKWEQFELFKRLKWQPIEAQLNFFPKNKNYEGKSRWLGIETDSKKHWKWKS